MIIAGDTGSAADVGISSDLHLVDVECTVI